LSCSEAEAFVADLPRALSMSRRPPSPSLHRALAVCLSLLSLTGCTHAMSTAPAAQHTVNGNLLPLRFKIHSFSAFAFNTLACRVIYDNEDFTALYADKPSGPPPAGDYRSQWGFGSYSGIRNFPGPVEVSWTSMDGQEHHATIDLAQVFKDERILHRVPDDEIPDGMYPQGLYLDPGIFVEVNDRTINVYMKAMIPTKHLQIPGNANSDTRHDLILAWTHTY
jgi:hypothetical protein